MNTPDPEHIGTASEIAALMAQQAGRFICIPRHVGGDIYAVRIVAAL